MASPTGPNFKALRKLSHRSVTQAELKEMAKQVYAEENDRGACLLLAADLENALDYTIKAFLELNDAEMDDLYNQEGPLGTFSRKISFASAVRIIGPISKQNFTIIRHVRNAFAHARTPIIFDAAEVRRACDALQIIRAWVTDSHIIESFPSNFTARQKYTESCRNLVQMLLQFASLAVQHVDADTPVSRKQFPDFNMVLVRKSLP